MIKVIETLDLTPNGLRLGKNQKVHLRQGDLDGACAVYSLMMHLIIIRVFTYNQVKDGHLDKRKSKGRIFREFFENQDGLIREGLNFAEDIQDRLRFAAKSLVDCSYIHSREETLKTLVECVNNNSPLMIGVDYNKHTGHALLAVGYEMTNEKITKIYCLDPSCSIDTTSYWNAIIRIDDYTSAKYRDSYITSDGRENKVFVNDALKIEKA